MIQALARMVGQGMAQVRSKYLGQGPDLSLGALDDFMDFMAGGGGDTWSGQAVTTTSAMRLTAVWRCIDFLSGSVAQLPIVTYRVNPDDGSKERVRGHYLYRLLHDQANPYMTAFRFKRLMQMRLCTDGNALAYEDITGRGQVAALWPLPMPLKQDVTQSDGGPIYRWRLKAGGIFEQPWYNILHIRGLETDGFWGMNPIQIHRETIGAGLAVKEHGARFFSNGARPLGALKCPQVLTPDELVQRREAWNAVHQGGPNAHKIAVLMGGMEYQGVGVNMVDAQYIEAQKLTILDICRMYGVFPHQAMELSNATYCLPGDAEVFAETGPRAIRDVCAGEMVWTRADRGWAKARIVHSTRSGYDRVLTIRTANRIIRVNSAHRILARIKERIPARGPLGGGRDESGRYEVRWRTQWLPAGQLRVGDALLAAHGLPEDGLEGLSNGRQATVEFLEFCGLLLGDGNVSKANGNPTGIQIARASGAPYMDHYRRSMLALFDCDRTHIAGENASQARLTDAQIAEIRAESAAGIDSQVLAEKYGVCRDTIRYTLKRRRMPGPNKITSPAHLSEGERQTKLGSVKAGRELLDLGLGGTAHTKHVPGWIFGLTAELRLAFLRGFLDADGSADKKGRISFSSCNRALLSSIRHLCIGLAVPVTNLRCQNYMARLPNGKVMPASLWTFTCSDPGANRRIGSHDPRYQERLKAGKAFGRKKWAYPWHGGRGFSEPGCALSRITAISTGEVLEPVYDLEVEEGHSFIADGVVVHNSNISEQRQEWLDEGLSPHLTNWEQELTNSLLSDREAETITIKFTINALMRTDPKARADYFARARQWGWMDINEIRRLEDMNPRDGGDVLLQPLNMVPVGSPPPAKAPAKQLAEGGG